MAFTGFSPLARRYGTGNGQMTAVLQSDSSLLGGLMARQVRRSARLPPALSSCQPLEHPHFEPALLGFVPAGGEGAGQGLGGLGAGGPADPAAAGGAAAQRSKGPRGQLRRDSDTLPVRCQNISRKRPTELCGRPPSPCALGRGRSFRHSDLSDVGPPVGPRARLPGGERLAVSATFHPHEPTSVTPRHHTQPAGEGTFCRAARGMVRGAW